MERQWKPGRRQSGDTGLALLARPTRQLPPFLLGRRVPTTLLMEASEGAVMLLNRINRCQG